MVRELEGTFKVDNIDLFTKTWLVSVSHAEMAPSRLSRLTDMPASPAAR